MLIKRSSSLIGKIPELLLSGISTSSLDVTTSPKSLKELKTHSSRDAKSFDLGGAVGLGIVAALDVPGGEHGSEPLIRYSISGPRKVCTSPIPVGYGMNCSGTGECCDETEADGFEKCSYGTYQRPENESFRDDNVGKQNGIFSLSLTRYQEDATMFFSQMSDFLSWCHLCKKALHGRDIYMYRGEKAFCSMECRGRQMMIDDDRKEYYRSVDISTKITTDLFPEPVLFELFGF